MLWKCFTQHASTFGKLSSGLRDWKRSVFIPIPKKGNDKEFSNYCTIALISLASKVMLKILQARPWTMKFQTVQAGFRKGRGTRDQIANIRWIIEKAREFQKKISILIFPEKKYLFWFTDHAKPLTMWIITNYGKFFKRWDDHSMTSHVSSAW